MTKQQKIDDLTTQLALVTAKLTLVERKLDQAEEQANAATGAKLEAEKQYRDLKKVMQAVLDHSPKPVSDYYIGSAFLKISSDAGLSSIPSLIGS